MGVRRRQRLSACELSELHLQPLTAALHSGLREIGEAAVMQ